MPKIKFVFKGSSLAEVLNEMRQVLSEHCVSKKNPPPKTYPVDVEPHDAAVVPCMENESAFVATSPANPHLQLLAKGDGPPAATPSGTTVEGSALPPQYDYPADVVEDADLAWSILSNYGVDSKMTMKVLFTQHPNEKQRTVRDMRGSLIEGGLLVTKGTKAPTFVTARGRDFMEDPRIRARLRQLGAVPEGEIDVAVFSVPDEATADRMVAGVTASGAKALIASPTPDAAQAMFEAPVTPVAAVAADPEDGSGLFSAPTVTQAPTPTSPTAVPPVEVLLARVREVLAAAASGPAKTDVVAGIKALLAQFDATNVTLVPAERRTEFLTALAALERKK